MVISIDQALHREPCKVAIGSLDRDLSGLAKSLMQMFGSNLSVVQEASKKFLNVTAKTATKPSALRKLLEPQGISLKEVLAFGDDLPDLDMLKECGMSVAMANAFPEVKATCIYQTASNDEDGVAIVLEKLLNVIG